MFAIGACVFFAYNYRSFQTSNKEQTKEQQQLIKTTKATQYALGSMMGWYKNIEHK